MRFKFTFTAGIVALAVLAAAAPQPTEKRGGIAIPITKRSGLLKDGNTVNLDALKSHVASVKSKIYLGFENYKKNTGNMHPFARSDAVVKRGAADILTFAAAGFWYGAISLGTPSQPFIVQFDTGSADFFIPSSNCDTNCDGHSLWNPSSSSTAKDLGQSVELTYEIDGGVSVSGEEYTDSVSIAGLTATGQTFVAANTYSFVFENSLFPADGRIGMAYQSISELDASPLFQTLVSQGQVADQVFSIKLSSNSGSELYIGGSNSGLYTGSFAWVPVTTEGFWQVGVDSIEGNGKTLSSNFAAIVDTGSNIIIAPTSAASELHQALGGMPAFDGEDTGYYLYPCNSFPSISITLGGVSFPIPATSLNLGSPSSILGSGTSDPSACVCSIVGEDIGQSLWVLGEVILETVYVAFDLGNSRIGFARQA